MTITLGCHRIDGPLFVAPMAGITDRAFRALCYAFGADYAASEMIASRAELRQTTKSQSRLLFADNEPLRVVQLLGADPAQLKDAFYWAVEAGAQVVDFNMGCPAKKVLSVACGSALMREEAKARSILNALGEASRDTGVAATLKCRTGWDEEHKNAPLIAQMAQDAGFQMVTVHGRSRAGGFVAPVEYETIAKVVERVSIPVVANGDITSGDEARRVMDQTGAKAVMVGRGCLGRPWVFAEMKAAFIGEPRPDITMEQKAAAILEHRRLHFEAYEEMVAVRTFRKHLLWYLENFEGFDAVRASLCSAETGIEQARLLVQYFASRGWL